MQAAHAAEERRLEEEASSRIAREEIAVELAKNRREAAAELEWEKVRRGGGVSREGYVVLCFLGGGDNEGRLECRPRAVACLVCLLGWLGCLLAGHPLL